MKKYLSTEAVNNISSTRSIISEHVFDNGDKLYLLMYNNGSIYLDRMKEVVQLDYIELVYLECTGEHEYEAFKPEYFAPTQMELAKSCFEYRKSHPARTTDIIVDGLEGVHYVNEHKSNNKFEISAKEYLKFCINSENEEFDFGKLFVANFNFTDMLDHDIIASIQNEDSRYCAMKIIYRNFDFTE